jgi:serine/threonine protein phosphatase 1
MKTLIIGDIHGCFNEFQELLARAGIVEGDAIIALGDIVDRGPETPEVLNFFRQQANARSLMGNHERKHVRGAHGEVKLAMSQIIARGQIGEAYQDALAFLETFPTYLELPEAILVHGYLEPGLPLEQQIVTVLCGTMSGDRHLKARYDRPWYELYNGEKPVIVGHHDYLRNGQAFVYQERVFGLDTSCVHGKTLTGLLLPDFTIFSVPGRGDLWNVMRKQYRQQHPVSRPGAPRKPRTAPVEPPAWDEESERMLQDILSLVKQENERVLAHLREQTGFENLKPRLQAKVYAEVIGKNPLATLLHLARKGELDAASARRVIKYPTRLNELWQIGLNSLHRD